MDAKKFILATIAGGVVMWLLAGLWYWVIATKLYPPMAEHPRMLFIILGYLVLAILMAYLYPIGYKGGSPLAEGVRFGIVMGLLWVLPLCLVEHGATTPTLAFRVIVIDAIWHCVEEGIGGIVMAYCYGGPAKAAAAAPAAPAGA